MLKVTLEGPERFVVGDEPPPQAADGEAIVNIRRIGVCGSDIHAFHGRHPFVQFPCILGHELSGTVVEVPDNDRGVKPGDRVSVEPFRTCGECNACKLGRPNCCEFMQLIGLHCDGGMRPRIAVPVQFLHRSDKLTHDQLATIEPLSIGAHAVLRGRVREVDKVLIVGAGPIGLATMQFALITGAEVTVVEMNEGRRQWVADHFGVKTMAAHGESRFDIVMDATGNAAAMERSFESVHFGGRLVFVGVMKGNVCFDDAMFHSREITLYASRNSHDEFTRIIRLIEDDVFDPTPWITHRMALADVPEQFGDVIRADGVVKPMIESPKE